MRGRATASYVYGTSVLDLLVIVIICARDHCDKYSTFARNRALQIAYGRRMPTEDE